MKNNGFTLIELLAVIVILAIIALIAVPIVLNIVKDSKEESQKRSIEMYAKALKNSIAKYQLDGKELDVNKLNTTDGRNFSSIDDFKVDYEGNIVCDIIDVYADGNIYLDKCKVNGEEVEYTYGKEKIYIDSSGVRVRIPSGLTPVIYKDGNWVITSKERKWHDYNNQEWANAVILRSDVNKSIGEVVCVEGDNPEVLAMFVYIPRYSYTIGNTYGVQLEGGSTPSLATPGAIDIKFIDKTVKEKGSAKYIGNEPNNWYTHPAFTFGDKELNGIWVGKFEVSCPLGNPWCSGTTDNLKILPNVKSFINMSVSTYFNKIKSMSETGNIYGLVNVDTHMIKNSEWGVVAYLSQSKYGKYGNLNYTGVDKEIYQNHSKNYITGSSNGMPSQGVIVNTQCEYDDLTNNCGVGASTTGNITGIYDMSGGADELVMGYLTNASSIWGATKNENEAGFKESPNVKYYDGYKLYGQDDIGHALSETSTAGDGQYGWYNNYSGFITSQFPWIERGGEYNNSMSGLFYFHCHSGGEWNASTGPYASTRVVLVQ